ncbi:MAG: hypothetical protein OXP09_17805 [Gammaproteobacteria bacterium]|nr:hypothetical protein [Gammaproteobacteria bacterium]
MHLTAVHAPDPDYGTDDCDLAFAGHSETKYGTIRRRLAVIRALSLLGLLCFPMILPGIGLSHAVASTDDVAEESTDSHSVPYFPSASDSVREGFVRVINRSDRSGEVEIVAVDDAGHEGSHVTLSIDAGETVHFNSKHLENVEPHNALKGSVGPTDHDWRLVLSSDLDLEVLAYIRTPKDGFLTSMHDTVAADATEHHAEDSDDDDGALGHHDDGHSHDDDGHDDDSDGRDYEYSYPVAIFNPGSNQNQRSLLRIINTGHAANHVRITGIDDQGNPSRDGGESGDDHHDSNDGHGHSPDDRHDESEGYVNLSIPPGVSRTLTAAALESGHDDFNGVLGAGEGKWQLRVDSEEPVTVMSLLRSPEGYLSNLSTAPANTLAIGNGDDHHQGHSDNGNDHDNGHGAESVHFVPMFPRARDTSGRQGFVRVINRSDAEGEVSIHAYDDSGDKQGPLTLTVGARQTVHFNSDDLESGAMEKGLSGSVMPGDGDWWLTMQSELDIRVLAYIRIQGDDPLTSGFLTAMHDIVPVSGETHRVAIFNPGSNTNQESRLRIVNTGAETAEVEIAGIDGHGHDGRERVKLSVAPWATRTISAQALEAGDSGFDGALGDGDGKWQLNVTSEQPIAVMSLMSVPTGHLTNLSTASAREPRESAAQVFHESISAPIVQARCVNCHVQGGQSDHTRLVFVRDSDPAHETTNFNVFRDFLASDDHEGHDHDGQSHRELILYKIQGMNNHGGGVQVPGDSEDFRNMERFLALLEAEVQAAEDGAHDHNHDH